MKLTLEQAVLEVLDKTGAIDLAVPLSDEHLNRIEALKRLAENQSSANSLILNNKLQEN